MTDDLLGGRRWRVVVLTALALTLLLGSSARADTVYLALIRGGHGRTPTVTGQARWEEDFGPVANRRFALLEVISEDPFLIFRHNSDSPHARTDAEGRFAFEGVEDGVYVLAIKWHPPFNWALLWEDTVLRLVKVKGESVEMGVVRVAMVHLWGE